MVFCCRNSMWYAWRCHISAFLLDEQVSEHEWVNERVSKWLWCQDVEHERINEKEKRNTKNENSIIHVKLHDVI